MMQWEDEGIVLSGRKFSESGVILDVFTKDHGRWRGLVYGGANKYKRGSIDAGNTLSLCWQARLQNQLGHFSLSEVLELRSARYLASPLSLSALAAITGILHQALPEAQGYIPLYEASTLLLDQLEDEGIWPALYAKWELGVLSSLGFGMDLSRCAITGETDSLTHVSPRSGRAVNIDAAPEYRDKLLPLPRFFMDGGAEINQQDIMDGIKLTGYFLERRLFASLNQPLPEVRGILLKRLQRAGQLPVG